MARHDTSSRKRDHVQIVLNQDVTFRSKTTGFEQWEFVHNALPELNFSEIDTSASFLGKSLSMPLMISCMTGGYSGAESINRQLAEVCERKRIAMGVGSQRQAMEDRTFHKSFSIVRELAPTIPIIGNIGGVEVARQFGQRGETPNFDQLNEIIHIIRADALAVHLNPVQELLQLEGSPNFLGVLCGIERLVRELDVPIIVKEVGAGISAEVARRLIDVGVRIVDVAGAGGTSWAGVEILRRKKDGKRLVEQLWDWGIPTAEALLQVAALKRNIKSNTVKRRTRSKQQDQGLSVIASGGIQDGVDAAKCLALGADLVASARPMLGALHDGGKKNLIRKIEGWQEELKSVMFLVGAKNIQALKKAKMVRVQ